MQAVNWLAHWAELRPEAVAVIDADREVHYTYGELERRAAAVAAFLKESFGIGRGDRVAFLAENRIEHLDLLFACGALGAIFVPLNYRLTARELSVIVADAEPAVAFHEEKFSAVVESLREEAGKGGAPAGRGGGVQWRPAADLEPVVEGQAPAGGSGGPGTGGAGAAGPRACAPGPGAPGGRCWPVDLEDPWALLYTGGTTGTPKGAVLSHRSITANAVNTIISWRLRPDDRAPVFTPFFHTGGWNVFTLPLLYQGATVVLTRRFDPGRALELIARHRLTVVFMVPTMFQAMADLPEFGRAELGSVRFFISGGAPCPLPLYETYWERGFEFKQGYGLTEAGPNTFALHGTDVRRKPGSVGRPLLYVETRIVDDAGADVGPGEVGELLVRGPHVFSGYWRRPEATAEVLGEDGWLRTGDLARRDEDGFYYIVDRRKQIIISGGENVYPLEVETVLHSHPDVSASAVFGVADPKWGEAVTAAVVLRPGARVGEEELRRWCRSELAGYKVPKRIHFLEALPQTPAGKIDKKALREMFSEEGAVS